MREGIVDYLQISQRIEFRVEPSDFVVCNSNTLQVNEFENTRWDFLLFFLS